MGSATVGSPDFLFIMMKFGRSIVHFPMSSSLKNEIRSDQSIVHFPMSSSLKNETGFGSSIVPDLVSSLLKNETRVMRIVLLLCQPH